MSGNMPGVGVVIPACNRPELLIRAVASIRAQAYSGPLTLAVVFDGPEPPTGQWTALEALGVRVMTNRRRPGVAGARNTGILELQSELIAFCDDDDIWLAGKLARQAAALAGRPEAGCCTTAMRVRFRSRTVVRRAGLQLVEHRHLAASRLAMLHTSSFLFRRNFLLEIGLLDENIPEGQGEDWDLLLRATRDGRPIIHLDEPLVEILWKENSGFKYRYRSKIAGLNWLLERHPQLSRQARAHARLLAQIAFWQACLGDPAARASARRARALDWRQIRSYLALMVARGWISGERLLHLAHKFGRGI